MPKSWVPSSADSPGPLGLAGPIVSDSFVLSHGCREFSEIGDSLFEGVISVLGSSHEVLPRSLKIPLHAPACWNADHPTDVLLKNVRNPKSKHDGHVSADGTALLLNDSAPRSR